MSYQDRRAFLVELACPVGLQGAGTTALPTSTLDVGRGRCVLGRLGALVVTQRTLCGLVEQLQCHRVGTMTSQKPRCQAGKAHKATCMPACSCRNRYSIDICGCPQASPETDGLTTRVLKFSILTGALRTGKQRTFFSGGMTFGSRKLRVGPEKGLGGTDSLLELHHGNRNSQMAVAHRVRQPSASLFFLLTACFLLTPLPAAWHTASGGAAGLALLCSVGTP